MKKILLVFCLLTNIGIAFSQKSINMISIYAAKDTISYYLSEFDSISHNENQIMNIYSNAIGHKYFVNDIDSICLEHKERIYYKIPIESLEDWENGFVDTNGCFIVYRKEELDGGYFCLIGEKGKENLSIALKFDENMNIQTIFSERGLLNILTEKETNNRYGIFTLSDTTYITSMDMLSNAKSQRYILKNSASDALNLICNWIIDAQTYGDIGKLFENGSSYLPGFILGLGATSAIWGLSPPVGLGLGILLSWLENRYEDNYNKILYNYMGAPMVWISDIDEKEAPNYKIKASINGLNTFGVPITCSLNSGIAVKINDSHVYYDNNDMVLNEHTIKGDETYNAELNTDEESEYYLRPYVVVMIDGLIQEPYTRQRYLWGGPKDPLITYGDVQKLKYEVNISSKTGDYSNVTDKSATVKCTYNNIPDEAMCGVEYESSSGWKRKTTSNGNGTRTITLTHIAARLLPSC